MIYVRRDSSLIPESVLRAAETAQATLETLPADERPAFIRKHERVWKAFSKYLLQMSYGKCWYSESSDPQSFFDVDHFRPKLSAKRSDHVTDRGYEWLAFCWDNYRLAAQRSNRLSTNEETADTEGKGDWFPLMEGSPAACWDDRCEDTELPVLLDPVNMSDVRLIDVMDDGRVGPSWTCMGSSRVRVARSIEILGLNLPRLKEARLRVMRDVAHLYEILNAMAAAEADDATVDRLPTARQVEAIRSKTLPSSPFSRAARAQLGRLPCGSELCARPEEA